MWISPSSGNSAAADASSRRVKCAVCTWWSPRYEVADSSLRNITTSSTVPSRTLGKMTSRLSGSSPVSGPNNSQELATKLSNRSLSMRPRSAGRSASSCLKKSDCSADSASCCEVAAT